MCEFERYCKKNKCVLTLIQTDTCNSSIVEEKIFHWTEWTLIFCRYSIIGTLHLLKLDCDANTNSGKFVLVIWPNNGVFIVKLLLALFWNVCSSTAKISDGNSLRTKTWISQSTLNLKIISCLPQLFVLYYYCIPPLIPAPPLPSHHAVANLACSKPSLNIRLWGACSIVDLTDCTNWASI